MSTRAQRKYKLEIQPASQTNNRNGQYDLLRLFNVGYAESTTMGQNPTWLDKSIRSVASISHAVGYPNGAILGTRSKQTMDTWRLLRSAQFNDSFASNVCCASLAASLSVPETRIGLATTFLSAALGFNFEPKTAVRMRQRFFTFFLECDECHEDASISSVFGCDSPQSSL